MSEQKMIAANAKLLDFDGDESTITCADHGVTRRWGDLDPVVQLAVLSGLDIDGPDCIMAVKGSEQ